MAAFVDIGVGTGRKSPRLAVSERSVCRRRGTVVRAMAEELSGEKKPGPLTTAEWAKVWFENIRQTMVLKTVDANAPTATGDVSELSSAFPFMLYKYFMQLGSVFILAFGPKKFYVVSDPVVARHILQKRSLLYDKGILSDILEGIMGKGLIPADFETWKKRRKAIVPGFHAAFLNRMIQTFGENTSRLKAKIEQNIASNGGESDVVDMEEEYCSLALDIIGQAIFNYDFNSVQLTSPVISAVYRMLQEAEWRSKFLVPIWNIEPLNWIVPRLRSFRKDQKLLNDTLDELISQAVSSKNEADIEQLMRRDYKNVKDPSFLRYLVDLRGEETTCTQLRDDLMTMLIAGHETTASVLTWATFLVGRRPDVIAKLREELDEVLGDTDSPQWEDLKKLYYTRRVLAESLRLYPQPPLLIRRALADDEWPQGGGTGQVKVTRGTDIFISVWNLHRSPHLWKNPLEFDPDRWLQPFSNPAVKGWKGLGTLSPELPYPNEVVSDFAFLPFGGGSRKCVGDQFAMLESLVAFAVIMRDFDLDLLDPAEKVEREIVTGATIHTGTGLRVRLRLRKKDGSSMNTATEKRDRSVVTRDASQTGVGSTVS